MIEVAIVEDCETDSKKLQEYIARFDKEKNITFKVSCFCDGLDFLDSTRRRKYDIIFLDIEMPFIDGMSVAKKIRGTDNNVAIVFVTNLSSYALEGYEVEAKAFLVKPVSYGDFSFKMEKIIKSIQSDPLQSVTLSCSNKLIRVSVAEIIYVESKKHALIYHTAKADYCVWNSKMDEAERILVPFGFARCNSGYVVNVSYISEVSKDTVVVAGEALPISRGRKKEFFRTIALSLGGEL